MNTAVKHGSSTKITLSQQVMDDVFCHLPYFILVADSGGNVRFANEVAQTIFGYSKPAEMQKPLTDLVPPEHNRQQLAEMKKALESSGRWSGEVLIVRPDSKQLIVEFSAARIDHEGKHIYLYSGQDVTGQRYHQRETCQVEKLSSRGEMAAEISHEMNNYLSIIMGNLELLGMGIAKGNIDSLAPRIKSMRDGLNRVTKFIEGLMSIARPEVRFEQVDLRQLIETEVFFLSQDPRYEGIEFVYKWNPNVPPVEAIPCRVRQAFNNIFSNACDALAEVPSGQKKITIEGSWSEVEDFVQISISDNGCGMSEEDYQKLFRQFFTTKGVGHGFGMLAIKGGIKSQGGRISAGPSADGGARFVIDFPRLSFSHGSRTVKISVK